jgi:hypothetical protein
LLAARPLDSVTVFESASARQWLGLSLVVLVLAGLFALAVVVGRMPPFDRFVTDPLFFKRCLVAHVNLALIVWFYSFIAALLFLLPGSERPGWLARHAIYLAGAGVVMLLAGAGVPGGRPVLSNYIPTIDHWLFMAGQLCFGLGVLASLCDRRLLPQAAVPSTHPELPASARAGLRAVAVALVLAFSTFAAAWFAAPTEVAMDVYHELLVWGAGHVLQLVCTLGMLVVWLMLLSSVLGTSPVSGRAASALFFAMLVPWTVAPVFALSGTDTLAYQVGFTHLMQWCIIPVVAIFLILCGSALWRAWREGSLDARALADPRISGFLVSAALTVFGFGLGAAIRGSNTMVPAHYHASVGAVTAAFMTVTYLLLGAMRQWNPGRKLRRAAAWQPVLYGSGMLLLAAGFALAGSHGMARKIYGAEQATRSLTESIGLGVMGLGGFVSIAGGLLFLGVVGAAWWGGAPSRRESEAALPGSAWRWPYESHG